MTVANTGSVSLSYDGDRRAAYLLLDDSTPTIRRVEYDVRKGDQGAVPVWSSALGLDCEDLESRRVRRCRRGG